jgi:hypothetical protein
MGHVERYLQEAIKVIEKIDQNKIEGIVKSLIELRQRGGPAFLPRSGGRGCQCFACGKRFSENLWNRDLYANR